MQYGLPREGNVDRNRRQAARKRCRDVLRELDIVAGQQLSLADVCDRVQRGRGLPLRLVPMVTRPGWPSGIWVESKDADVVLFDAATSALHQVNIIAHEFGHIALGHNGTLLHPSASPVFRWLDNDTAPSVMMRTGFDDRDEHEAEVFATMVCACISQESVLSVAATSADSKDLVGRLLSALADPRIHR